MLIVIFCSLKPELLANRFYLKQCTLKYTNQEEVKKKYHMLLNNEHITSIIINYDNDEEGYQKLLNRIKGLL